MNLYSVEVKLCATAYIQAENEEEAQKIAEQNFGELKGLELPIGGEGEVAVSGEPYDSPNLPDVSLSPNVTCYGAFDGSWDMELVEDFNEVIEA